MEGATQNISSPLAASHFIFVWSQAAVLYPCPPFPAIHLQANHAVCTERFVLGSSVLRVIFSMMWCKCLAAQDNLANLWLLLTGHRCPQGCNHKYLSSWPELSDSILMFQVMHELSVLLDQAFITDIFTNSEWNRSIKNSGKNITQNTNISN